MCLGLFKSTFSIWARSILLSPPSLKESNFICLNSDKIDALWRFPFRVIIQAFWTSNLHIKSISLTESTLVVPQLPITVLTSKIPTIPLLNPLENAVSTLLPWMQMFAKFGWILITLISQKLHPLWVHVSIHLMWQVAVPEPITPFVELYLDNTVSFLFRL